MNTAQRLGYSVTRVLSRVGELLSAPDDLRPVMRYTMVSRRRLENLRALAAQAVAEGVPGDFMECGTWKGGSGALLAQQGEQADPPRTMWFCDSYQGLPQAGQADGWFAQLWTGRVQATPDDVRAALASLGVSEDHVRILRGWFNETLPTCDAGALALLHIDCDWYDSVMCCLDCLWERVSPGGFVVFDDYGYWPGCRAAADEFLGARGLRDKLVRVDATGCYLRKP